MTTHVAILRPHYIDLVLDGAKTIEARLSVCRIAPFGIVETGEELFLRAGAMGYAARANVGRVWSFDCLTPGLVRELRTRFEPRVQGGSPFWRTKRSARFATFIELRNVQETAQGPPLGRKAGDRRAWFVMDLAVSKAA